MKRLMGFVKDKLTFLGAVVIAAIVGGATVAAVSAAIPDTNGQINACYKNSTQALRVTDPAGNCATNETALNWQQSSGVHVYSKIISVPFDTPPQLLVSVPDFGDFKILRCSNTPESDPVDISYTNTTTHIVSGGGTGGDIAPGETQRLGGANAGQGAFNDSRLMLNVNTSTIQKVLGFWQAARLDYNSDQTAFVGCSVAVQAQSSLN